MNDLDRQVAEAMGWTAFDCCAVNPKTNEIMGDRWSPSTSYDQIIGCIEAKGWDWVDFVIRLDVYHGPRHKISAEALCRAFLAACEKEGE